MPKVESDTKPRAKVTRITDLKRVKELLTRPPAEERARLAEQGVHYVGDDAAFERIQQMVADSGAILEGHFNLGAPGETTEDDA